MSGQIIIPRNFVLLEEQEKSEKGQYPPNVSVGLADDDILLHAWNGLIMSDPRTCQWGDIVVNFEIYCSDTYPDTPPNVKCVTDLQGVPLHYIDRNNKTIIVMDESGNITKSLPVLSTWNRNNRMIDILSQLKLCLDKRRCS